MRNGGTGKTTFGLGEKDLVLGQHKVSMFYCSYYSLNIKHPSFTGIF